MSSADDPGRSGTRDRYPEHAGTRDASSIPDALPPYYRSSDRGETGPPLKGADELKKDLMEMFSEQRLAVLATQQSGAPYGNLVAFAATEDAKTLMFATSRSTRKYVNISADSRIALVIDNRSNEVEDFHKAMAATAVGSATEVGEPERGDLVEIYLRKHPYLSEFLKSPTCALLKVDVQKYVVVYRFQNVMEIFP
jgi:uncharacterized protein YhbP (UPF0306 family)